MRSFNPSGYEYSVSSGELFGLCVYISTVLRRCFCISVGIAQGDPALPRGNRCERRSPAKSSEALFDIRAEQEDISGIYELLKDAL